MKAFVCLTLLALSAGCAMASGVTVQTKDKTITKVVKLLQDMLVKSKDEGDEERKIFAKFKCYCDQSEADKTASIESQDKTISLLESTIEELQGSNGEASSNSADLKARMEKNEQVRKEAQGIRDKQNEDFKAEKKDLETAIGQMADAITTLTAVGADQTKATGADNKQFMAGYKGAALLDLQSTVKDALSAAEAFMNEKQYKSVTSFLQAPFTGTYTSQSGAVMGIIKSMKDTFEANLETAIANEKQQADDHAKFMDVKKDAWDDMKGLYEEAQDKLGDNDGALGSSRKQLAEAEKQKAEDEDFLEKLRPMCKEKTEDYEHRKSMRAGEEVAIAEAISILNSDAAFATFSGVSATSFLQTAEVKRHIPDEDVRAVMQRLLRRAAAEEGHHAPRLHHVMNLVQAGNPFDTVLDEIEKMIGVIDEEGKADKEKFDFCKTERAENNKDLKEKNGDILNLKGKIDGLEKAIGDPVKGLKKQIANTEDSLEKNRASQKKETEDRTEANTLYQADAKNLAAAKEILNNAMKVLNGYYDQIDTKFLQSYEGIDAAPKTWEGKYKGNSAGGNDVIKQLKFIYEDTEKEEVEAHTAEEKAQASYEDSMTELKKQEGESEKSLTGLQKELAKKEEELLDAQEDLKATTKARDAVEDYLEKIKPGCDFIQKNFDLRNKNRGIEKAALNTARDSLKGSPAYKKAESDATVESYGDCKEPCVKDPAHADCLACRADVTVPAYCAGHAGTPGCK